MIYSIGEALIDIFEQDGRVVELAGGTSANLSATIAMLGGSAAIITKLGMDCEAKYIVNKLSTLGVDISNIKFDEIHPTGKVLISPLAIGSALCANRKNCADRFLTESDIAHIKFTSEDILHFCSFALIESPAKYAVIKAVKGIGEAGGRTAFDINLRLRQWNSPDECIGAIADILPNIDYLKASCEELNIMYGNKPIANIISDFFKISERLSLIILTDGDKGSSIYSRDKSVTRVTPFETKAVDFTGAGDCFFGAALLFISQRLMNKPILNKEECKKILEFAAAATSLHGETIGAIDGIPSLKDVEKRLQSAKPI
ncbi:MAG: hypothetical protein EOM87_01495 [Clostridia bacterium]|nr:hypothetical protein [Clostridia bacterium]